jgi:hypothetical protein
MATKAKKWTRITLSDLPGARRTVRAYVVPSVTAALGLIREGKPVTASGSSGAISVWRDHQGNWRGEFDRFLVPMSTIQTEMMTVLRAWLKKWWPELGR